MSEQDVIEAPRTQDQPQSQEQSKQEGPMARQEAVEELRDDINRLKEDLKAILQSVGDTGGAKWEKISNRVKDQAMEGYGQLRDAAEVARQRGSEATQAARETVSSHPLSWVLGAVGLGIILGRLMGRR